MRQVEPGGRIEAEAQLCVYAGPGGGGGGGGAVAALLGRQSGLLARFLVGPE